MANLSFNEKQLIETVFGLRTGYVLDFNNREFKDFMNDVVPYDIYQRYPGLSKAKMLRRFIEDESDVYVGKMIVLLINYMKSNNKNLDGIEIEIEKLYELGKSKLGISKSPSYRNNFNTQEKKTTINYTYLKELLLNIEKLDNQQHKGYAFERYLIELFNAFSLEPRTSYRTEYNQIDGSIILNGSTVLIEAKYKDTPINKDPFILFSEKIENKSPFTKGIFITLTRPSYKTLEYFNDKTSRFIIFTVEELYILCDQNRSLEEILKKKFRLLEETGCVFHHILQL